METKFSIITPAYNSEKYIRETIGSVMTNRAVTNNSVELEYIVCDGGSTDKTTGIVEEIFSSLDLNNVSAELISENDTGMYDALSKGLMRVTGNIISYINAGDYYSPHAFEIVDKILNKQHIKWITGMDVVYNEKSHIVSSYLPFRYKKRLIQCGFYNLKTLPHIQQESTFWHSKLNSLIDYERLRRFKYAGDYYLWKSFSEVKDLYIVEAWLAGFKVHQNQLSGNAKLYGSEMKNIALTPKPKDFFHAYFEKILWSMPNRLKKMINRKTLLSFNHAKKEYMLS